MARAPGSSYPPDSDGANGTSPEPTEREREGEMGKQRMSERGTKDKGGKEGTTTVNS